MHRRDITNYKMKMLSEIRDSILTYGIINEDLTQVCVFYLELYIEREIYIQGNLGFQGTIAHKY